jgi:prepilin-type N-terminal cleavage/methylation domain-containing protein
MINKIRLNQSGFTLIEIIATVVIVSVFCAIMITLFSDSLIKSSDNVRRVLKTSDLSRVMANITADYQPYPKWKPSTVYSASSPINKVLPTGMNGRFYICTGSGTSGASEPVWHDYGVTYDGTTKWEAGTWKPTSTYEVGDIVIPTQPNGHFYRCVTAGTSGASEPAWPLTGTGIINDGAQWRRLLDYLQVQIGPANSTLKDNSYGKYYVDLNRFVKFDASNTVQPISGGEPENMLQVKIRNDEGETLSALFTVKEE